MTSRNSSRVSARYEIPRFSSGIFSNKVLSYVVSG